MTEKRVSGIGRIDDGNEPGSILQEVTNLRFVQWQQAMLIVAPFVLLFVYVVWIHLLVRGQGLHTVLLRLLAASAAFTAVWATISFALFIIAWMGTSDVMSSYDVRVDTYRASVGLPFAVFEQPMRNIYEQLPALVFPQLWVPAIPLFGALLFIGCLVALAQHLLSRSRFSVDEHRRSYAMAMVGAASIFLVVFLWPQSSSNPQMPSVPIPDDAVAVRYTLTPDSVPRLYTTFALEHTSSREAQKYYEESLVANGWKLAHSQSSDAGSGMYSSTTLFTKDGNVLEVGTAHGYETAVTIAQYPAQTGK
ncbi:MAG: hypothetical protein ABI670_08810 [Chloroflexota bacterium]